VRCAGKGAHEDGNLATKQMQGILKMTGVNLNLINEQLLRLKGGNPARENLSPGKYLARSMTYEPAIRQDGQRTLMVTFGVAEGDHVGRRIVTPVWGRAEQLVTAAANHGALFSLDVFTRRLDDGREFNRVNIETIRLALPTESRVPALPVPETLSVPSVEAIQHATAGHVYGFRCIGRVEIVREIVDWHDCLSVTAECTAPELDGRPVFGSTYAFTDELLKHIAENDRQEELRGSPKRGSMMGFKGTAYAALLTFDIDRTDDAGVGDPENALHDTIRLVVWLVEAGVAAEDVYIFFSGYKGFHVQFPTMLTGAVPSLQFVDTAKQFCTAIAAEAGIAIDENMYKVLQPLRAPNSRNEKSGLFKVRIGLEELVGLNCGEIQEIARSPRPFTLPSFVCSPLEVLADRWRTAERAAGLAKKVQPMCAIAGGQDEPRVTGATWGYLVNGAEHGERATALFKAAANLADFESHEELIRALLQRPVEQSGLSPSEAKGHVDSAIRRAMEQRMQQQLARQGQMQAPAARNIWLKGLETTNLRVSE